MLGAMTVRFVSGVVVKFVVIKVVSTQAPDSAAATKWTLHVPDGQAAPPTLVHVTITLALPKLPGGTA